MASTSLTATTAVSASTFASSLGINTHIDFATYGYQNLANVESDIKYLGVKNIRDSAQTADRCDDMAAGRAGNRREVRRLHRRNLAVRHVSRSRIRCTTRQGRHPRIDRGRQRGRRRLSCVSRQYPAITAQFQQQVYALGKSLGLPVFNMSFGAGWTAANGWQGDYGEVGNLSAYTTYAQRAYLPGSRTAAGSDDPARQRPRHAGRIDTAGRYYGDRLGHVSFRPADDRKIRPRCRAGRHERRRFRHVLLWLVRRRLRQLGAVQCRRHRTAGRHRPA